MVIASTDGALTQLADTRIHLETSTEMLVREWDADTAEDSESAQQETVEKRAG